MLFRSESRFEAIEHNVDIGRSGRNATSFRATTRWRNRKIEFARIEIGHLHESFTDRIESQHVRIHLTDARGDRVDSLLDALAQRLELGLLLRDDAAHLGRLIGGEHRPRAGTQTQACVKRTADQNDQHERQRTDGERRRNVDASGAGGTP